MHKGQTLLSREISNPVYLDLILFASPTHGHKNTGAITLVFNSMNLWAEKVTLLEKNNGILPSCILFNYLNAYITRFLKRYDKRFLAVCQSTWVSVRPSVRICSPACLSVLALAFSSLVFLSWAPLTLSGSWTSSMPPSSYATVTRRHRRVIWVQ